MVKKAKAKDAVVSKQQAPEGKRGGTTSNGSKTPDVPDVLRKPTAKQLVGGASWTGKLPTALLHEYCQKQGWLKPDCNVSHKTGAYTVSYAVMSKKNPKNSEVETVSLRPTKEELDLLPGKELAVEARNVAATWCLHRIAHRLNFSMQMPPDHRQLWNKLELLRKDDTKNGKGWLYEADPFKAANEHAKEVVQWEKEKTKREEIRANSPQVPSLNGHSVAPWKNVPMVEMSKDVRRLIESGIRSLSIGASEAVISKDRADLVHQIVHLGFRKTHAEEACDHAATLESALEFLLLFLPEDDLPHQFLPPNYSTGLSGSSHDTEGLQMDYAARRLHLGGYAIDLCRQVMTRVQDEELAGEILQADLLDTGCKEQACGLVQEEWLDEVESLKAIYGESCKQSKNGSEVSLVLPNNQNMRLHLRPPVSDLYPRALPSFYLSSTQSLPCYIKLAIIKSIGDYAKKLTGEPMVFLLLEYIDEHVGSIIANPGKLLDLSGSIVGHRAVKDMRRAQPQHTLKRKRRQLDWTPNSPRSIIIKNARDALKEDADHKIKLAARSKLPAYASQASIVEALQVDQCLVISGETGSGKSTQVVQYILDTFIDAGLGEQCQILCTQPRRISALGLADRVGDERSDTDQVGYAIRGASKQRPNTKITFLTTGVLLRRLTVNGDAGLDGITHVFVDEVHERSIDSDFLLISLKEIMRKRKDLKVILMSATVEAELFCRYLGGAKHLHIEGRTFPVLDYYLDDMHFLHTNEGSREKSKNGVDYELIATIVEHIDNDLGRDDMGAVLIFLPGAMEISRALQEIDRRCGGRFNTLPLHASLPAAQQKKVFLRSPHRRKIIAATNVAETSITIDDVVAVIDTGRVKQMNYDITAQVTKFEEVWCSKAACKQRRGRAGRVQAGKCYKTFTRALEAAKMSDNTPPEIIRTPLEQVLLSALAMNKDGRSFLKQAVTVPDQSSLDSAMSMLRQVGAIDEHEQLTSLGRLLALVPADLKVAKLLILASIFGCLERALIVAGCLSSKSPFFSGPNSNEAKARFAGHDGDVLCDTRAYEAWSDLVSFRDRRQWCEENHVSDTTMQEIRSNISQYHDSLKEAGLVSSSRKELSSLTVEDKSSDDELLKAMIASALSPNIARIQFPDKKYASTIGGTLEKDHESKTIKFYTQKERIFLHPSSTLFSENVFRHAFFISFFQQTLTTKMFVRSVTPNNMYGQMLLGESLALDTHGRGLLLNGWIRVAAWPKIAVFVKLMRQYIEELMEAKIDNPQSEVNDEILALMRRLILHHGH